METKHTKGEWTIRSTKETKSFYSNIYSDDVRIAEVKSFGKDGNFNDATFEEKEANAKLIAAAPELLESLARILDRIKENNLDDLFPSAFDRAKNAIKKATE